MNNEHTLNEVRGIEYNAKMEDYFCTYMYGMVIV